MASFIIAATERLQSKRDYVAITKGLTAWVVRSWGVQLVLCNEALAINTQRTSSNVHAELEQEGASFNSLAPPLGL